MEKLKDSVGNEFKVGAICRFYHFTGARNRKHYMYKEVVDVTDDFVCFDHLPRENSGKRDAFRFKRGSKRFEGIVIVQAYYDDHRDLKKNKSLRD